MSLYVVSTPLGNLDDVTVRALRVLQESDLVACEDTRVARRLFERHGLRCPKLVAFHEHNEKRLAAGLARKACESEVALVTNAGTPAVSDPGFRLVSKAIELGAKVVPVPGPTAVTAALVASGLPTHRFLFLGYPPRRDMRRKKLFRSLAEEEGTLVFFESPRRLARALADARDALGDRRAVVARELTKLYEEFARGTLGELAERYQRDPPRGECTLLIEGRTRRAGGKQHPPRRHGDTEEPGER